MHKIGNPVRLLTAGNNTAIQNLAIFVEILFVWFHLPTAGLWLCCDLSRPAPALFAGGFDPLQIWEGTICKV